MSIKMIYTVALFLNVIGLLGMVGIPALDMSWGLCISGVAVIALTMACGFLAAVSSFCFFYLGEMLE